MRVFQSFEWNGLAVYFCVEHLDGRVSVAEPLVMRDHAPGEMLGKPTLIIKDEDMQGLMNSLWAAGVRPHKNEIGHTPHDDIKAHLQDMRAIAFSQLNIPKETKNDEH